MNKKITVIPIIIIVIVFAINFSSDSNVEKSNNVFHITLADPNLYTNGVYFDEFTISKGKYSFSFVPNGSSPKKLSIKSFLISLTIFSRIFILIIYRKIIY